MAEKSLVAGSNCRHSAQRDFLDIDLLVPKAFLAGDLVLIMRLVPGSYTALILIRGYIDDSADIAATRGRRTGRRELNPLRGRRRRRPFTPTDFSSAPYREDTGVR